MKITIESTDLLTTYMGAPVRVWTGTTARGIPCVVLVRTLAVREDRDQSEFERELAEELPFGRKASGLDILDMEAGL